eukprot:6634861-Pyramimonas_sp.AAC.1
MPFRSLTDRFLSSLTVLNDLKLADLASLPTSHRSGDNRAIYAVHRLIQTDQNSHNYHTHLPIFICRDHTSRDCERASTHNLCDLARSTCPGSASHPCQ